ncbi:hypothetical protein BWR19_10125 [Halomonas sp. 1513]|nr:O-antigen polymerase [Halomonas sp. 1513]APX93257.1 hypothetical protein BWR19_10125 [Halomonas sp. 1513]
MDKVNVKGLDHSVFIALFVFSILLLFIVANGFLAGNLQAIPYLFYFSVLIFFMFVFSYNKDYFNPLFYVFLTSIVFGFIGSYTVGIEGVRYHRDHAFNFGSSLDEAVSKHYILLGGYTITLVVSYYLTPSNYCFIKERKKALLEENYKYYIVVAFWLAITIFAFFVYSRHAGGFLDAITQRSIARNERVSAAIGGHYTFLINQSYLVPLTLMAFNGRFSKKVFFWGIVLFTLLLGFLVTGSRGGVLSKVIIFLCLYFIHNKKIPFKTVFLAASLLLVAIGAMTANRSLSSDSIQQLGVWGYISSSAEGVSDTFSEASRRGAESNSAIGMHLNTPEVISYQFGKTYLSVPFIFIPAAALPFDKPNAAGYHYVNQLTGRVDTAWPIGSVAEAYWNFSYFGVFLSALIVGFIYKISYNTMLYNSFSPLSSLLFLAVVFRFSLGSDALYGFFHFLSYSFAVYLSFYYVLRCKFKSL